MMINSHEKYYNIKLMINIYKKKLYLHLYSLGYRNAYVALHQITALHYSHWPRGNALCLLRDIFSQL